MRLREANFDGLVGPTHNYAGLSWGNVASSKHAGRPSRPRDAALQGLEKMGQLASLGLAQGVLPPQERPDVQALRRLGFQGTDHGVLERAKRADPVLLAACCSASSMWAANAATVAPAPDTADGRTHLTPANLGSTLHRSFEPPATARALGRVFPGGPFVHHPPLPPSASLGDEGAANHTRLQGPDGRAVHVFVYGRRGLGGAQNLPAHYPARQTLEASQAIARLHLLDPERTVFAQQNPDAIDQGVFHNDVIAVGHGRVLLHHEQAFADSEGFIAELNRLLDGQLVTVRVRADELTVEQAVRSYLFNSQLVSRPQGRMALVAPAECEQDASTRAVVERIVGDDRNPIDEVHYIDVRQSMQNGGGPACLRLRVPLQDEELAGVHPPCMFDDTLHAQLETWVRRHYRDELRPDELSDPRLLDESRTALDELTRILQLGSDFYPFQRDGLAPQPLHE
jgi:succinylarginine dihydrolase